MRSSRPAGTVGDLAQGHDPIEEALRRMRWRSDAIVAILTMFLLALIAPLWVASPPPLDLYALANVAFFIIPPAAVLIGTRLSQRRMRRSLQGVRSRVREAGVFSIGHLSLILDNGLLLQLPGSFAILTGFFSSSGSPLSPSLREARKCVRPFRWIRLVTVRAGKKAPDLTELRDDLGARMAAASVGSCRPKGHEIEPNTPTWIATVVLGRAIGLPIGADRIIGEADRVGRYLQNLVQATLKRARSLPAAHP